MRFRGWQLLLTVAALAVAVTLGGPHSDALAAGSASLTVPGDLYAQDFNTLASSGTSTTVPSGWDFFETGTSANTTYGTGTGSSLTGDTYSFGAAANVERAFGTLFSNALSSVVGVQFANNTGSPIQSLLISYTGEQWRLGQNPVGRAADRLDFQLSTNAASLSTGTWVDQNALDFFSPVTTGTVGALNGNLAPNRTALTYTITGLNIPDGATFWLRWADSDLLPGADDGLAVDDFSLTPYTSPTDIALSGTSLPENAGANSVVGTLSGTDPDLGQSATLAFSLPAGLGDNSLFNISGTTLRATDSLDFEGASSRSLTMRATDAVGLTYDKTFVITVTDVNEAPSLDAIDDKTTQWADAVNFTAVAHDVDAGTTLAYGLSGGAPGSIDPSSGAYSWTPGRADIGVHSFDVTVSDGGLSAQTPVQITVTTRAITVTAISDSRAYDGTTGSAGTPTLTAGTLATDDVGDYSQTFDTPHAGTGKALTPVAIIRDAGNNDVTSSYAVTLLNDTTGVITKAAATVDLGDLSATYTGGPHHASAATTPPGLTVHLAYSQGGTPVVAPTAAGSYDVSAAIDDPDYSGGATGTLVIAKADALIDVSGWSGPYDGAAHGASGTASGVEAVPADLSSLLDLGASFTDVPGGTVHWSFAGNGNYSSAGGDVDISIARKTVTGSFTADNKEYDGTRSASVKTYGLSGVIPADTAFVTLSGGTATFDTKDVGTDKAVALAGALLVGTKANDYTLTSVADDEADITARGVSIAADASQTKVYGGSDPTTYAYHLTSGALATGDLFTGALSRVAGENVGAHQIQRGNLAVNDGNSGGNYTLTYTPADFIITPKHITGGFTAADKVYDGTRAATVLTRTLNDVLPADVGNVTLNGGTALFDTATVGNLKPVTLTSATLSGTASTNYALDSVGTTTASITRAHAMVTLTPASLTATYDGGAHYAAATTTPAGLTVVITYAQGGTPVAAPTAAGSYGVSAVVNDTNYQGSTTGTLVISPAGPTGPTRYEQTDHALPYHGSWMTHATSPASGGDFSYTDVPGASVTVRFNGTYLAWIGKTSKAHGYARVTLDDRAPVMVDLYSSATLFRQKVWETPAGLTEGNHTLTIECTHTGRRAAIDTNINVDAFDIRGTLIGSEGLTRYQQSASLVHTGLWSNFPTAGASFGSYWRSSTPGASVTIPFKGTRLDWVATKGTTLSKADVYVDDVLKGTIDLANPVAVYQQKVFSTGDLADGYHTVKIVRSASDAAGKFISVDAVDVQGTLVPLSSRYEQADTRIVKVGAWSDFAKTLASGGSYARSNTSDASATIYFTGTRLDWIAMKGSTTGIADVYLDGVKVATVNLAAPSGTYNVNVWSTGALSNGNHSVRIVRSSASATGRYLTLDAFDVWGMISTAL